MQHSEALQLKPFILSLQRRSTVNFTAHLKNISKQKFFFSYRNAASGPIYCHIEVHHSYVVLFNTASFEQDYVRIVSKSFTYLNGSFLRDPLDRVVEEGLFIFNASVKESPALSSRIL